MKKLLLTVCLIVTIVTGIAFTSSIKASASSVRPATTCIDIPANPDYLSSGSLNDAIAAINNARSVEHLPQLNLPGGFTDLDAAHQQLVLINLERNDRGLKALHWDNNLAQIALNYSKQLLDLNFFSHTSPISGSFEKRIDSNSTLDGHYSYIAENIAGNPVASAGAVYEYMYNDSAENCGHRDNILNKNLKMVGIGEIAGGTYGSMSAQEFMASAPWNPYHSITPNTSTPSISIQVGKIVNHILPLTSKIKTDTNVTRVTWFVDKIELNKAQIGTSVKIDTRHLSHGLHKIFVFAVNSIQNFGMTQIQVSI